MIRLHVIWIDDYGQRHEEDHLLSPEDGDSLAISDGLGPLLSLTYSEGGDTLTVEFLR